MTAAGTVPPAKVLVLGAGVAGLQAIAEQASTENTGARGLLTVCERELREFKYELPSSNLRQFVVTRALVENPAAELERKQPSQVIQRSARDLRHDRTILIQYGEVISRPGSRNNAA